MEAPAACAYAIVTGRYPMERFFFITGACSAGLAVLLGAFGAHWLNLQRPEIWTTAAGYQMSHAVALMVLAWAWTQWGGAWMQTGGILLVAGIVLFSGSLYALSLTGIQALGAVTPIGGLCFLGGWTCLVVAALN